MSPASSTQTPDLGRIISEVPDTPTPHAKNIKQNSWSSASMNSTGTQVHHKSNWVELLSPPAAAPSVKQTNGDVNNTTPNGVEQSDPKERVANDEDEVTLLLAKPSHHVYSLGPEVKEYNRGDYITRLTTNEEEAVIQKALVRASNEQRSCYKRIFGGYW